jgi:GxxExxY protein
VPHQKQVGIPVKYEDIKLNLGLGADIIVANKIIVELKSVTTYTVHKKQLLTYLKRTDLKLG